MLLLHWDLASSGITSPFHRFCLGPCGHQEERPSSSPILSLEEGVMGMASARACARPWLPIAHREEDSKHSHVASSLTEHTPGNPVLTRLKIFHKLTTLLFHICAIVSSVQKVIDSAPLRLCEAGQWLQSALQTGNKNFSRSRPFFFFFLCPIAGKGMITKWNSKGLLQHALNEQVWILAEGTIHRDLTSR